MFRILLFIFLIAIGIFFSFSWAIVYHLVKFGVNRRTARLITFFFISGSLIIMSLAFWALLSVEQ